MFLWDEITGEHRSDDVASCILKWLHMKIDDQGKDFTILCIICDNCGGQNKNISVLLMVMQQVHGKWFVQFELVFMKSGHSHLPCDIVQLH